jgi:hypothetical protein
VGEPFLAWAAADRAIFAAEQSGDPLLAAASAWRLSYMITGRKHPQEALDLAMAAAAAFGRTALAPSPQRLSVYGALHLAAATAAAASFDRTTAQSLLATARGIADRTGEANHMGTAFGPVNVAIHAISASLKLGDPRTAAQTGEALDLAAMPVGLVGRRTQVHLDLARAYAMTRKDAAAGFEARGAETAEELAAGAAAAAKLARASRAAQAMARAARAETATTAALRTLSAMFPNWRPAAETLLRHAEINMPRPVLRNVALELSRVLGGRTIASLAAADLAALEDEARARMLMLSTAVDEQLLQAAARRAVRALGQQRPGNTALVTVPARDGLWVYVLPATRGDVVLGEAFAPARAGVAVPRDPPPLPGVARPLWALDDGTLAAARPTLPDLRLSTDLPPNALQEAPSTLIAGRSRTGSLKAACAGSPSSAKPEPAQPGCETSTRFPVSNLCSARARTSSGCTSGGGSSATQ